MANLTVAISLEGCLFPDPDDERALAERPVRPEATKAIDAMFDAGHDLLLIDSCTPTRVNQASVYGWVSTLMLPVRGILLGPDVPYTVEADIVLHARRGVVAALAEIGESVGVLITEPGQASGSNLPVVSWVDAPDIMNGLARKVSDVMDVDRFRALTDAVRCLILD